jgi:hypothetical protein
VTRLCRHCAEIVPARDRPLSVDQRACRNIFGLPVEISFMGTAFSEPKLIKVASGLEAATKARKKPKFLPALPDENPTFRIAGRGDGDNGNRLRFNRITNPACGPH